jgi:DNA repair exonuclease SbcCD ATPase subunit
MDSEKMKEIKKALECCKDLKSPCGNCPYHGNDCLEKLNSDMEDYINELENLCNKTYEDLTKEIDRLESENERLKKSDTSKEESSIEYYNLYKDLKRKNKDLNELCELQRVSIAESFVRENQLKDRIAELEKGKIEFGAEWCVKGWEMSVKQFAERLKEKADGLCVKNDILYAIKSNDIDETLKEFING